MRALIFCGYHNTGKTTMLLRAVRGLTAKGFTVSTVKHSPGMNRDPASPGGAAQSTDSERLLAAGSAGTVLVTATEAFMQRRLVLRDAGDPASVLSEILGELRTDFVLIEGFKRYHGPLPKILLVRKAEELSELTDETTVAYSGLHAREGWSSSLPYLPHTMNEEEIAAFVLRHAREVEAWDNGHPE
jgi:molybdopterin-guanine dinucleotide biosynthesis protein MobB